MTKYNLAAARRALPLKKDVHPIWRGIGCLLILFVPLASYILANTTIQLAINNHWPMPTQLMGFPSVPIAVWRAAPGLTPLFIFIQGQNNLYAVLGIGIMYIVIFGALISLLYSIIYKFVGPPQYTEVDEPPPNISVKKYRR